jgi:hypothetical protein
MKKENNFFLIGKKVFLKMGQNGCQNIPTYYADFSYKKVILVFKKNCT